MKKVVKDKSTIDDNDVHSEAYIKLAHDILNQANLYLERVLNDAVRQKIITIEQKDKILSANLVNF